MRIRPFPVFLLFIFVFQTAVAQENVLKGGDFDEAIETFNHEGLSPVYLPGWDLIPGINPDRLQQDDYNNLGLNKWGICAELMKSGTNQFLRLKRYPWANWEMTSSLQQTISVIETGTYKLSFDTRFSQNPIQPIEASIVVTPEDFPEQVFQLTEKPSAWKKQEFEIQIPRHVHEITLRFTLKCSAQHNWDTNLNNWYDLDNISLVCQRYDKTKIESTDSETKLMLQDGQLLIDELQGENTITVYSVLGKQIASFRSNSSSVSVKLEEKGLYIVKINEETKKILYP